MTSRSTEHVFAGLRERSTAAAEAVAEVGRWVIPRMAHG